MKKLRRIVANNLRVYNGCLNRATCRESIFLAQATEREGGRGAIHIFE